MSEKYKAFEQDAPYFVTFTLVQWIPLFEISEFATIIADSISHCQIHKGLLLFGYCIMPSHVHLIVQSKKLPLGTIIRDSKKYTATMIAQVTKCNIDYSGYLTIFRNEAGMKSESRKIKVWQDGYHPEIIFSNKFFFQKLKYIHKNPVTAGLVSKPEEYYYSSARNYAGMDAPLDIIFESQQLISY